MRTGRPGRHRGDDAAPIPGTHDPEHADADVRPSAEDPRRIDGLAPAAGEALL